MADHRDPIRLRGLAWGRDVHVGDRVVVTTDAGWTHPGEIAVGSGNAMVVELDAPLDPYTRRAWVRRPHLELTGSRQSAPAADTTTATPSPRTSRSGHDERPSETRRW